EVASKASPTMTLQRRKGEVYSKASPTNPLQRSKGVSGKAKRLPLSSDFYIDYYSRNQRATAIETTPLRSAEIRGQQQLKQHLCGALKSEGNSNWNNTFSARRSQSATAVETPPILRSAISWPQLSNHLAIAGTTYAIQRPTA